MKRPGVWLLLWLAAPLLGVLAGWAIRKVLSLNWGKWDK